MKTNFLKIAGIILLALLFIGCNLLEEPEVLINNRINDFESALNAGNYSGLQTHFHPDMVSYESYLDTAIFQSGPLSSTNSPFVFGSAGVSDGSGGNKIATGTFSHTYTDDELYSAVMKEDGDAWKILEMTITVGGTPYYIRQATE